MAFKGYRRDVKRMLDGKATKKVTMIGAEVTNHIKLEMRKPKSGRQYNIPGTGSTDANGRTTPGTQKTYTASAPGEYPAIRTGQLRSGIRFKVEQENDGVSVHMGTNVDHGIDLELGLRPWLSKALEDLNSRVETILGGDWE